MYTNPSHLLQDKGAHASPWRVSGDGGGGGGGVGGAGGFELNSPLNADLMLERVEPELAAFAASAALIAVEAAESAPPGVVTAVLGDLMSFAGRVAHPLLSVIPTIDGSRA